MVRWDTLLALALSGMEFLTPRERIILAGRLGTAAALERLGRAQLEQLLGRRVLTERFHAGRCLDQAHSVYRSLILNDIMCMFYGDPGYPERLRMVFDPPLVLFYRGALPPADAPTVAVVGTRRPADAARRAARELGTGLARAGATVVSGLARGIDGEAHRGAVAGGGAHVAVLGSGLAHIHPATNTALGRRILSTGGALVSEYAPEVPPRKHQFPARNRLISGLSRVVVVVQAPARSGALITADFALEQGRDVVVHEAGLWGMAGEGTAALAESGARVVRGAADVLDTLGVLPRAVAGENPDRGIEPEMERLLDELDG